MHNKQDSERYEAFSPAPAAPSDESMLNYKPPNSQFWVQCSEFRVPSSGFSNEEKKTHMETLLSLGLEQKNIE
jgi:hypothetical protein